MILQIIIPEYMRKIEVETGKDVRVEAVKSAVMDIFDENECRLIDVYDYKALRGEYTIEENGLYNGAGIVCEFNK